MTNFDDYATWALSVWHTGEKSLQERDLTIMSLGLAGETGEVIEILKKRVRDGELDITNLKKELGDVIYYWSMLCTAFGLIPSDVIDTNVKKLESRKLRKMLHGSGDDR